MLAAEHKDMLAVSSHNAAISGQEDLQHKPHSQSHIIVPKHQPRSCVFVVLCCCCLCASVAAAAANGGLVYPPGSYDQVRQSGCAPGGEST